MVLLMSSIAFAIPQTLTLQGKLTNQAGASQSGTYNFAFKIYDNYSADVSAAVYSKNLSLTTDANGIYDVILNNVTLPFDKEYYLGITVGADDESTPRINLTTSPYSFRANISENLNPNQSYAVSNINVSGNLTVGTSSAPAFYVDSTSNLIGIGINNPSYLLQVGNVDRAVNLSNVLFVNGTSGNVGIGTRNPIYTFQILGNSSSDLIAEMMNLNSTARTSFYVENSGAKNIALHAYGSDSVATVFGNTAANAVAITAGGGPSKIFIGDTSGARDIIFGGGSSEFVRFALSGNVGIGTSSPNDALEIIGNVRVSGSLNATSINASNIAAVSYNIGWTNLSKYPSACPVGEFMTAVGDTITCQAPGEASTAAGGWTNTSSTTTTPLSVIVNSNSFVVNATSHNVGFGTNSPQYRLQVATTATGQDVNLSNVLYVNGSSGFVGIGLTNPDRALTVKSDGAGSTQIKVTPATSTNPAIYYASNQNGELFIGTEGSSAGNTLVGTLAYATMIGNSNANPMQFFTNNAPRAIILSTGEVGIGTSSPINQLTIAGSVTAFGSLNATRINATDIFQNGNQVQTVESVFNKVNASAFVSNNTPFTSIQGMPAISNFQLANVSNNTLVKGDNATITAYADTKQTEVSAFKIANATAAISNNTLTKGDNATLAQWKISGNNIFNANSANVGIGTSSPAALLQLAATSPEIRLNSTNGGYIGLKTNSVANTDLDIQQNGTSRIYIAPNGSIGMGTTTPDQKLTIYPGGTIDRSIIHLANRAGQPNMAHGYFSVIDSATSPVLGDTFSGVELASYRPDSGSNGYDMRFILGGTSGTFEVLRIKGGTGNIGIGTTAPAVVLDVKGKANFTGNFSVGQTSNILFVDNTSGYVGIGTSSPINQLTIAGSVTAFGSLNATRINATDIFQNANQVQTVESIFNKVNASAFVSNYTQYQIEASAFKIANTSAFVSNNTLVKGDNASLALWKISENNIFNANSANVGIGTSAPNAMLEVNTTLGTIGIATNGSVGIGTANPTAQLEQAQAKSITSIVSVSPGYAPHMKARGRYAFTFSENGLADIYTIFNNTLKHISRVTGSTPTDMEVIGNILYTAEWPTFTLLAYSIADIQNPILLSNTSFSTRPIYMAYSGSIIYLSDTSNNLIVLDASNPKNISTITTLASLGETVRPFVDKSTLFLEGNKNLFAYDLSDPKSPQLLDTETIGTSLNNGVIRDGIGYFTDTDGFVRIVDVSNASMIRNASSINTGNAGAGLPALAGKVLYVGNGDSSSQLRAYDVSSPTYPVLIAPMTVSQRVTELAAIGRYLLSTSSVQSSFVLYDIGGSYLQTLEAGATETTELAVRKSTILEGRLTTKGDSIFAGPALFQSQFAVSPNASNGLFVALNSNVGIGTSSPINQLTVVGSGTFYGSLNATSINSTEIFQNGAKVNSSIDLGNYLTTSTSYSNFQLANVSNNTLVKGDNTTLTEISNTKQTEASAFKIANATSLPFSNFQLSNVSNNTLTKGDNSTLAQWNAAGNNIFNKNSGNVGIGTANPGQKLVVVGNANISQNLTVNNSVLFVDGTSGKVGIGTSAPSYPLTFGTYVSGGSISSGGNFDVAITASGAFIGRVSTTDDAVFGTGGQNNNILFTRWTGSTNAELMRISSSGSVGINTTQPGATLTVAGNLNITPAGSGGIPSIFVSSKGNVGIGTSTPVTKLQISNDTSINTTLMTSDPIVMAYSDLAPGFSIISASNGAGQRAVFKGVRARGNLTNPSVPSQDDDALTFLSALWDGQETEATAGVFFKVDGTVSQDIAPQRISFVTSDTNASVRAERMVIKSDGRIGINTTSPAQTLTVQGTTNITKEKTSFQMTVDGNVVFHLE